MGNSAKKREQARIHNEMMKERAIEKERVRIDRIENPEKYEPSKEAVHNARMFMAMAGGMGLL